MAQAITVHALSRAESPITHMAGTAGNEAIVAREPIQTPAGKRWVPHISGNAIRHQIREHGFLWLIDRWELQGKLNQDQLTFLLNGGANTSSGQFEDTRRLVEWATIFPLGGLLGGCMADQIIGGSLDVWRGRLVCEENRPYLGADLPYPLPEARLRCVEDFLGGYQYTRAVPDATLQTADYDEIAAREAAARESGKKDKSDRMIFGGQFLTAGTLFAHGFVLHRGTDLHLGALLWSLALWQMEGGTIGGQASRGHGRLKTWVRCERLETATQADLVQGYMDHCDAMRERGTEWLETEFGKARKTVAGKKK